MPIEEPEGNEIWEAGEAQTLNILRWEPNIKAELPHIPWLHTPSC